MTRIKVESLAFSSSSKSDESCLQTLLPVVSHAPIGPAAAGTGRAAVSARCDCPVVGLDGSDTDWPSAVAIAGPEAAAAVTTRKWILFCNAETHHDSNNKNFFRNF